MDPLVASTVAQSQALIQNQVAVSMLKKTLDLSAEQGAELVKIMSQTGDVGRVMDLQA